MKPVDTLKPGQVAKSLDVSGQTLRRWVVLFKDYLSAGAQPGRRRRFYSSVDVATLRYAGSLIGKGLDVDAIRLQLAEREQVDDTEATALIIAPELVRELTDVKASNQQLVDMLKAYSERVQNLERRDVAKDEVIASLLSRLDAVERRGLLSWLRGLRGG